MPVHNGDGTQRYVAPAKIFLQGRKIHCTIVKRGIPPRLTFRFCQLMLIVFAATSSSMA
jgi:hypothetical protein